MLSNGKLEAAGETSRPTRQHLNFSVITRVLIAAALLFGIFSMKASFGATTELLRKALPELLLLGLLAACLGEVLTGLKWYFLLRAAGERAPLALILKASFIGIFYNHFLPGSVGGDVAKTAIIAPVAGGISRTVASIFMQRNTGLGALFIIANAAVWLRPIRLAIFTPAASPLNDLRFWFALITIAYVIVNVIILSQTAADLLSRWVKYAANRHATRLQRILQRTSVVVHRLHDSMLLMRRGVVLAVALSVVTQLVDCWMVYIAARAIGLHVTFLSFCIFVPAVNVASLIPISFNGLGLREAVYIVLLAAIGVSAESAVAVSLLHFAFLLCLGLVGAVIQWHMTGRLKGASATR